MGPEQARDLILSGKAPKSLTINGNLCLNGCTNITHLPESLSVGGWLSFRGCTRLTHLPETLTVGESLWLDDCTSLTHLPESLTVCSWLSLQGCTSLRNLAGDIKGSIFCDPEFIDQIEDWPLHLSYVPNFTTKIQAMIERKLRHGS